MRLVTSLLILLSTVSCRPAEKNSSLDFYSADSMEAVISYRTWFLFPKSKLTLPSARSYKQMERGDKSKIGKALKLHTLHLYGVFSYHEKPIDFSVYNGSIMERSKQKILKIENSSAKYVKVHYEYQDRSVFYKELFTGKETRLRFYMPNSPLEVYEQSIPSQPKKNKDGTPFNPCTSKGDNSEAAFWYYWSPDRRGCPSGFRKKLHFVDAKLSLLPQTKSTYPEYKKLFSQKKEADGRGKVRLDLVVGPDEKFESSKDLGRVTFEHTFGYLSRMRQNGKATFTLARNDANYKVLVYDNNLFKAEVHIHYRDPDAATFSAFASKVLRYSDIFIYSGHSYEGEYFKLQTLFNKKAYSLPKSKYQIMFFNACTTYAYYNFNYFKAKRSKADRRGTKNLDIMTNAIGSPFLLDSRKSRRTIVTTDIIAISSLLGLRLDGEPLKRWRSWQEILKRISANSGYDFTGLTNVMGDEDNPRRRPQFSVPGAR
ncbi:hypothetical protein N9D31_02660 [Oligoflexaceae bacterium]|nr:hypothetical protein [Oligoflexaceae bacterium]